MYRFSYAEVMEEGAGASRERERMAVEKSIDLMKAAEAMGPMSREAIDAIYFVRRLWSALIEDLGSDDNQLPRPLRASLISIGLFIMNEAEKIRTGSATTFKGIIEISETIREGLR